MIILVSPYHLTTREPAALAAMLLADQVVTMLPAPLSGKEWSDVRGAAVRVPRYLEFMQTWQWTMALWKSGVIGSRMGDEGEPGAVEGEAVEELRAVCDRIESEEWLSPLRSLMRTDLFEDHERYLDTLARDLLKAGPDPGITVPVAAGLDALAARHSGGEFGAVVVARSEPISVVQKAEAELGEKAFSVSAPVLLQADADRILEVREELAEELGALRTAFDAVAEGDAGSGGLAEAAKKYAAAFEGQREELLAVDPDDEVRIVEGTVMLTGVSLPVDCVFEASLSAMRTMGAGESGRRNESGEGWKTGRGRPTLTGTVASAARSKPVRVLSIYVRVLGRPAAARR